MFNKDQLIVVLTAALLMLGSTLALSDIKSPLLLVPASKSDATESKPAPTPSKIPDAENDKPRGQLLYENHCGGCHQASVHSRISRKADSIAKIRHWVNRWQKELKLNWSENDIKDVANYLNDKYYQF
ncbi:hypothetical protein [Kaarinaea lacus]